VLIIKFFGKQRDLPPDPVVLPPGIYVDDYVDGEVIFRRCPGCGEWISISMYSHGCGWKLKD